MSVSKKPRTVTLIPGDGIGPEVVHATCRLIAATGAELEWDEQIAGRAVFESGDNTGVPQATIESIKANRVALKGPLETPIGFGGKSANVTLRKLFETFGNTRPARVYPGIETPFSDRDIDLVVVRENVEDLYAGIEYMSTPGVAQCLKLISVKGCEKIVRLAFELAVAEGRRSVTCVTKANIMKLSEGTLKRTFERIAEEYPGIEPNFMLVDNCAHQLVRQPEAFDVLVTTNMNGDILSDLVSGLVGGLGLAPGANIGRDAAIFEAVHGTAPDIAGKDLANPTATMLSGVMMLRHLGLFEAADKMEGAIAVTLEEGPRTGDICGEGPRCGTTGFTDAVIGNLGRTPANWKAKDYRPLRMPEVGPDPVFVRPQRRRTLGLDVFVESGDSPEELGKRVEEIVQESPLYLKVISNRGTVVYPPTGTPTDCVHAWRCRFLLRDHAAELDDEALYGLVRSFAGKLRVNGVTRLEELDGERGYTLSQGED